MGGRRVRNQAVEDAAVARGQETPAMREDRLEVESEELSRISEEAEARRQAQIAELRAAEEQAAKEAETRGEEEVNAAQELVSGEEMAKAFENRSDDLTANLAGSPVDVESPSPAAQGQVIAEELTRRGIGPVGAEHVRRETLQNPRSGTVTEVITTQAPGRHAHETVRSNA